MPGAVPANTDVAAAAAVAKVQGTVTDLGKTLAGITDGATAEKAKPALEGQVKTLGAQLNDAGASAKTQIELLLKPVLDQVNGLLGNADVKKVIGPVLEQLKGLVSAK